MPSNKRLLATLLGCAALLWPVAADAVTIGTQIAGTATQGLVLASATAQPFTTTGPVPAGGLLVVAGEFSTTTSAPNSLTGCSAWTQGQDIHNGALQTVVWYTACASGLASTTTVTLNQTPAAASFVTAIAYPATVTTHDLSGGAIGTGTAIAWTTGTPTQANEILLAVTTNATNSPDIVDDPTFTCIVCDSGSGSLTLNVSERVLSVTAVPITYAAHWTGSVAWASGFDSYLYTPGGGGGGFTHRSLTGAGK